MDQALAVKAIEPPLGALGGKSGLVLDAVEHPVDGQQAVGAGMGHDRRQPGLQRFAIRRHARPQILGQIVDAQH
ncbi:hypothetical protein D3C72_1729710 [compost metagenome]